jgi:hypothetical protein
MKAKGLAGLASNFAEGSHPYPARISATRHMAVESPTPFVAQHHPPRQRRGDSLRRRALLQRVGAFQVTGWPDVIRMTPIVIMPLSLPGSLAKLARASLREGEQFFAN